MAECEVPVSDEEIRQTLVSYGDCSNIPINSSTRPVLLRKIAQLAGRGEARPSPAETIQDIPTPPKETSSVTKNPGFLKKLNKLDTVNPSQEKKANGFHSIKIPDINMFRKLIEDHDVVGFAKCVWDNPRYLITQGDKPEILKKAPWYNALHCAAKVGSLEICKKLFEILEGDRFWSLVYPNDLVEIRSRRRSHLLDLYLNTCDKGFQETPLHFACKYGHEDVVSYLLTFHALDTEMVNKHGETAYDVAGRNSSAHSKHKVQTLLSAVYFVPVLRAVDNSLHPRLSAPCTLHELENRQQKPVLDKRDVPVMNSAMAGPMSPLQAESFYKEWRHSPSESERKAAKNVMRSDPDRGLERVGRKLAHQQKVEWKEYWGFLNCACDLSQREGLEALEKHLGTTATEADGRTVAKDIDILEELANLSLSGTPRKTLRQFLAGSAPTKLDYDVMLAVSADDVDMESYPNIVKWQELVGSYTDEEKKGWRTPKRRSLFSKQTPQFEQFFSSPLLYSSSPAQHTPSSRLARTQLTPSRLALQLFQD